MVAKPNYLSYFQFKKEEDIKKLAKEILDGTHNFDEEEGKLNRMLYEMQSKSEKFAFFL